MEREAPSSATSERSDGSRSPDFSSPDAIHPRIAFSTVAVTSPIAASLSELVYTSVCTAAARRGQDGAGHRGIEPAEGPNLPGLGQPHGW